MAAWSLMKMCTRNASRQPRTPQIHLLCARTLEESFRDFMSQFSQSCTKTLRQHLLQPQPKQGGRYAASLQDEGLNTNAVIRVRGGADSPLLWQLCEKLQDEKPCRKQCNEVIPTDLLHPSPPFHDGREQRWVTHHCTVICVNRAVRS